MAFKKTFEVLSDSWLIIAMLYRVEIVSVDVWHKNSVEIEIVSITESNTTLLFSSVLSTKTPLCIIYCFAQKYRPGTLL